MEKTIDDLHSYPFPEGDRKYGYVFYLRNVASSLDTKRYVKQVDEYTSSYVDSIQDYIKNTPGKSKLTKYQKDLIYEFISCLVYWRVKTIFEQHNVYAGSHIANIQTVVERKYNHYANEIYQQFRDKFYVKYVVKGDYLFDFAKFAGGIAKKTILSNELHVRNKIHQEIAEILSYMTYDEYFAQDIKLYWEIKFGSIPYSLDIDDRIDKLFSEKHNIDSSDIFPYKSKNLKVKSSTLHGNVIRIEIVVRSEDLYENIKYENKVKRSLGWKEGVDYEEYVLIPFFVKVYMGPIVHNTFSQSFIIYIFTYDG